MSEEEIGEVKRRDHGNNETIEKTRIKTQKGARDMCEVRGEGGHSFR